MLKELLYKIKWSLVRPGSFERFDAISSNEKCPIDILLGKEERKLKEIVRFAFENIPFYREKYRLYGFSLSDMEHEGWFEKLPIVTKKDLREHFGEFVNPLLRKHLKVSTTGGSTGAPTKTGYDGRIPEEVYSWRLQNWFGVKPWDDHAYVWRDTRSGRIAKFKNALLWWPTKHLKMDATFIAEKGMSDFVSKFNRLKPTML